MSETGPTRKTWIRHIFFTLTEHGAIRVLDAATTLVLIRVMSGRDFGLFSLYQSWVGLLLLLLPSLEIALYRDYAMLKANGALGRELRVYRTFSALKLMAAAALVLLLACVPQPLPWVARAALLAFAMALPLSQAFYGFLREPLRFELKQHLVTLVSALQRATLLAMVVGVAMVWPGNILALSLVALATYVVFGWVWSAINRSVLGAHVSWLSASEALASACTVLTTTVLWIHVNGVISQAIQTLDTFALGAFHVDLEEIGRYGIALKAANFFQLVPVALVNAFGVYLGRVRNEPARELRLVRRFSILFVLLSLALFGLGVWFEQPMLAFLGKGKITAASLARTVLYFRWQLAGVLIFCAVFPLSTYLGARARLKAMFFGVFAPWAVFSTICYFAAAAQGPLMAAKANVLVYLFLALALTAQYLWQR